MAKAINISEEEKKQIVNTYQFYKASGAKISVLDLAAKFKHNHYKIVEILREYGVLKVKEEEIIKTEHKIWHAEKIVVNGKEYYDVSSAPRSDGFLEFGIESVKTQKFPEWKRELQRRWNNSKGRRGVNFGVEV